MMEQRPVVDGNFWRGVGFALLFEAVPVVIYLLWRAL